MSAKIIVGYRTRPVAQSLDTLDCVFLVDSLNKKPLRWDHADDSNKPPVSVRVRNYLLKAYPGGWSEDYSPRDPVARFIGFGMRRFLDILGLELSLPHIGKRLPLRMWLGNTDYRDIGLIICPPTLAREGFTLDKMVQARRPVKPGMAKEAWDATLPAWKEPHINPEADVKLAIELAAQLGLLEEE